MSTATLLAAILVGFVAAKAAIYALARVMGIPRQERQKAAARSAAGRGLSR
ncbi:MAG: hypothetical protein ACK5OA_01620 [Acidovorax sp.]|jgi:hypothetical protein